MNYQVGSPRPGKGVRVNRTIKRNERVRMAPLHFTATKSRTSETSSNARLHCATRDLGAYQGTAGQAGSLDSGHRPRAPYRALAIRSNALRESQPGSLAGALARPRATERQGER
jgi:hypothetical protein